MTLPLTGAALARLPALTQSRVARAIRVLPFAGIAVVAARTAWTTSAIFANEPSTTQRGVAFPSGRAAVLLADSLERTVPRGRGRILTVFNYGNALLWRLPDYQTSIDGRTIFPDSVALQDAFVLAPELTDTFPSVIGSAELAVLPLSHSMQRRVSRTPGWRRLATVRIKSDSAALWARESWLRAQAAAPAAGMR